MVRNRLTSNRGLFRGAGHRVTIFVVGNKRDIRKLHGGDNKYIGGFYVPRAGASRAFVQNVRATSGELSYSMIILLHEYAHHFLISSSRYPMPRWMSEGAAEFFASAQFPKSGVVQIGRPPNHRAAEFSFARDVSVRELLDPAIYEANKRKGYDAFYGRSWLLYHYLTFNQEREGQMSEYWLKMLNGTPSLKAAEEVFGDLDQLEKELDQYLRRRRMSILAVPPEQLHTSPVTVRELSEGEGEILPIRIRSQRGVDEEQAAEIVLEARAVAKHYPGDAAVLAALAEAEFDSGNDAEAIAAADRAIAIDPSQKNAYVQKGYALFRIAEEAEDEPPLTKTQWRLFPS